MLKAAYAYGCRLAVERYLKQANFSPEGYSIPPEADVAGFLSRHGGAPPGMTEEFYGKGPGQYVVQQKSPIGERLKELFVNPNLLDQPQVVKQIGAAANRQALRWGGAGAGIGALAGGLIGAYSPGEEPIFPGDTKTSPWESGGSGALIGGAGGGILGGLLGHSQGSSLARTGALGDYLHQAARAALR